MPVNFFPQSGNSSTGKMINIYIEQFHRKWKNVCGQRTVCPRRLSFSQFVALMSTTNCEKDSFHEGVMCQMQYIIPVHTSLQSTSSSVDCSLWTSEIFIVLWWLLLIIRYKPKRNNIFFLITYYNSLHTADTAMS